MVAATIDLAVGRRTDTTVGPQIVATIAAAATSADTSIG